MRRREFITLVGGLFAWPVAAHAQQRQPQLVGILSQDLQPGLLETFRDELRRLGYVEDNIKIELRDATGRNDVFRRWQKSFKARGQCYRGC